MFKFGFDVNEEKEESNEVLIEENKVITEVLPGYQAEEVNPSAIQIESETDLTNSKNVMCVGNHTICYINPRSTIQAISNHSDLLSGQYEGGMKIWECTQDLIEYLNRIQNLNQTSFLESLQGKFVLDLGCGAGILGILALHHKAVVHFQDYNKEVILNFTNPNVVLNFEDDLTQTLNRCKFFSGDWESYDKLTSDIKFDVILTSETIYNSSNHKKLISVLKNKLKLNGVTYLAAKTYYFGVGGGIRQFEKCISEEGCLKSTRVWQCNEGIQREILKIEFNI